jgi:hypothetical protein
MSTEIIFKKNEKKLYEFFRKFHIKKSKFLKILPKKMKKVKDLIL